MDFSLNPDQAAIVAAIDRLAQQFEQMPTGFDGFVLPGDELEKELELAQYFDLAAVPELGPVAAALAIERLSRLPCTVEVALSMLLRPAINPEWPRPVATVEQGRPGRFVATAKTLVLIDAESVSVAHPGGNDVEAVESLYAYPMGRVTGEPAREKMTTEQAARTRTLLRIACAAEMAGLLQAAIDATVEHLTVRKQFGRPLGTFQALRHRMAECAVLAGGVKNLALKAAYTGDAGDAALAALQAQHSASRVVYDVHQMFGAMGMTLEMPLHLWTYRMKALLSELGGRGAQAAAVAQHYFAVTK
ncbi:MAG: acyl-CoA dehydrogenase family protein [Halieaceae bacterium]|nr:acyl-CoA dehydrogenase family protein [Halieaceae bacterium]